MGAVRSTAMNSVDIDCGHEQLLLYDCEGCPTSVRVKSDRDSMLLNLEETQYMLSPSKIKVMNAIMIDRSRKLYLSPRKATDSDPWLKKSPGWLPHKLLKGETLA